jgi:hypothetical protein
MNAYDDKKDETLKTKVFIQRDIERLTIQKSEPDAPKKFILEAIAANEARLQPLDIEMTRFETLKLNLIRETDILIEKYIRSLSKAE